MSNKIFKEELKPVEIPNSNTLESNLSKAIDSVYIEKEKEKETDVKQDYKKPKYPIYCPKCGKGFLSIRKRCTDCSYEIDYSAYTPDLIEILSKEDRMIFDVLEKPYSTYQMAKDIIEMYYFSTAEHSYLEIGTLLLNIITNMKDINYNSGAISSFESLYKSLNVTSKNPKITENLSEKDASCFLELCEGLITHYDEYLGKLGVGDRNYEEIQAFLRRNIFDKKLFKELF